LQVRAQQSEKPLLSHEIRSVLERDGAEAATERFKQLFPAEKDKFDVDQKGFGELVAESMQRADFGAGQAVMQMLNTIVEAQLAELEIRISSELEMPDSGTGPSVSKEKPASDSETATLTLGPARTDLARFTGVYGTPENEKDGRTLFVAESCDGHLVAGPMWADTSPWWMTSTSDTVFDFRLDETSVHMEFAVGPDGRATSMHHDLDFMGNPLPRVGPLPEGWRDCVRPSWG
jgi:hypothetical protein